MVVGQLEAQLETAYPRDHWQEFPGGAVYKTEAELRETSRGCGTGKNGIR